MTEKDVIRTHDKDATRSASESENPVIPSPTPKRSRPRTNNDWWPNQLDLSVLHRHSALSNPIGEDFSYREVMTNPAAMHFDEWAGIYLIVRDLGVSYWQQDRIFDLSFAMYRTRADVPPGADPRRYAWENGEVCEYRLEGGQLRRRTALLVHLQKRTMRAPTAEVLDADRYWILPNRFAVQHGVSPWSVRAARIPTGHELVPFYWRRIQRSLRRRAARRAAAKRQADVRTPAR